MTGQQLVSAHWAREGLDVAGCSGHTSGHERSSGRSLCRRTARCQQADRVVDDAIARAARGETVAVIAGGKHVADLVSSAELRRLRETIEVLSDSDAVRALADIEEVLVGREAIRSLVAERGE